MSLEQIQVVDAIGIEKGSGHVILTIVDSLEWDDEESHICLLQKKLNTYLRFLESGEIDEVYPKAMGRKRVIKIVARHKPTKGGFEFLKRAASSIQSAGFGFAFEVRGNNY